MRVSVELIPRSGEDLDRQLREVTERLPSVNTINIPDVLRFPLRSWDACARVCSVIRRAVPHVRAIDVDPCGPLPFVPALQRHGLREVLVVAGDAPPDESHPTFDTTSAQLIRRLRSEAPELTVYAALDPYRQSFVAEREYVLEKLEAGAHGLFTQPFFDLRLMEVWGELLEEIEVDVFWGVTSVTSPRSTRYWTGRNRAVLPKGFEPSLEWSRALARDAYAFARSRGDHIYFMPIRVGPGAYLDGIV